MDVYAENVLDHYRQPRNKLSATCNLQPATLVTHTEENLSCGDTITIQLTMKNDHVASITWDGTGCAISQAAMSMLSEELAEKTLTEIEGLTPQNVYDLLGVPIGPRRTKCALLGLHTVKNAMRKHVGREVQSWTETLEPAA